jgi:hypothetical protein
MANVTPEDVSQIITPLHHTFRFPERHCASS